MDIGHELDHVRHQLLLILAACTRANKSVAVLQGLPTHIQRAAVGGETDQLDDEV